MNLDHNTQTYFCRCSGCGNKWKSIGEPEGCPRCEGSGTVSFEPYENWITRTTQINVPMQEQEAMTQKPTLDEKIAAVKLPELDVNAADRAKAGRTKRRKEWEVAEDLACRERQLLESLRSLSEANAEIAEAGIREMNANKSVVAATDLYFEAYRGRDEAEDAIRKLHDGLKAGSLKGWAELPAAKRALARGEK